MSRDEEKTKESSEPRAKKERVLHTRVSVSLEDELKERASHLGVSVSNLVRNVLLNTFEMVEDIVSDGSRVAKAAKGRSSLADQHPASVVPTAAEPIGWQPLILNLNALCSDCNAILPKGGEAVVAIQSGGGPRSDQFLCKTCLAAKTGSQTDAG